jgi:PLP dependent protein
MSQYEKAWQAAHARINQAVEAARRERNSVQMLAVSKTFPPQAVRDVYALGQRAFGENYVQEAIEKQDALSDLRGIEWHLIGPLQSNKARMAAEHFDWIETVDRLKIADRLSAARPPGKGVLNVLIQVNASGEPTKSGVSPDAALALARDVHRLPRLTLRGIMGIPEATDDVARQRAQFLVLRRCFDQCRAEGLPFDTLSMGMSADLEAAIAAGATEVRLGTAIFGERNRSKV